jgi:phospholipase/carboxylesterase
MLPAMALDTLELQSGDHPVASVIVLHGLGADGNDFVPIAQELDLSAITVNGGMQMRAWYDIFGADLVRREDETGLRASVTEVQVLLDREAERGIPPERTVLMGFSQGCAMTLLAGLRAPQRLAGLACLSGYLPLAATTASERSATSQSVPVFMAHGRFDPVVPLARGTASRDTLLALGHSVEWHDYPMQHSVCQEEIEDLNAWLLKVLAA